VNRESLAFLVAGTFFGLLVGWIIGSQHATPVPAATTAQASGSTSGATAQAPSAPALDTARAAELERAANASPNDADARLELANLYFNAERFDLATPWYEAVLKLDSKNVNASTDLGVCYYYTNQVDRALAQFDVSLRLDPRHVKTLFNQGVVLAFGKRDLRGAEQSWQRVVALAPDSEEGKRAKQGLEGLRSAHGAGGGSTPDSPATGR
jgi:tetratricopeptide (TPR) repeat protein